jgi:hypothetical protein
VQDLFSCKQQLKEPLSQYFRRFIQIKAQVSNVPNNVVIIAAIKGLRMGQNVLHILLENYQTQFQNCTKSCKNSATQMMITGKE